MSSESLFPGIPGHWKVTTLGELAQTSGGGIQTGPFGSQLHASDYVDDGVPSIMPKNISVDTVTTDEIARVSPDDVERLKKYKVQTGDIIYSRRGDVEKCARITEKEDGWLCGTGCLRVRVKPGTISTEYLHAYLCNPTVREWIVRHAVGATMPNLNTSILCALPVVVPSKPEMVTIGSAWLNISDKIQLNHQINQTLEQMAQAIFKSWFVDFGPVKAKIAALEAGGSEEDALLAAMQAISGSSLSDAGASTAGADTPLTRLQAEQSEQYAKLRATAELFPSAMQDSELGEIPEGWNVTSVSDVAEIVKGKSYRSVELEPSKTALVTLKSFKRGGGYRLDGLKEYTGKYKQQQEVTAGDLIIAYTDVTQAADVIGKPAMVIGDDRYQHLVISLDVAVFRPKNDPLKPYLYGLAKTDTFQFHTRSHTTGTTVLHLAKNAVPSFQFALPSRKLSDAYANQVNPLFALIDEKIQENRSLETLRGTLLPKLLSGELSVSGAENEIAEAEEVAHG